MRGMTVGLPTGYTLRPARMSDLDTVVALFTRCSLAEHGSPDFTREELLTDWQGAEFDFATDTWAVFAEDGTLAAYADAWREQATQIGFAGRVDPAHMGRGIGTYLLAVADERAMRYLPEMPPEARVTLRQWIPVANRAALALVQRAGYTPIRRFWRMLIELEQPPEAPIWPKGITLRTMIVGRDEEATHAAIEDAFADHWGHPYVPFDRWRQREIAREDFDPTLWLLAMSGEEIAGVAHCRMNGDMGWVDELGVRPAWRRRGIALALLHTVFDVFSQRAVPRIGLGVDAQSTTGARQLYERAGMRPNREWDVYEKVVRDGDEAS